MLFNYFVSSSCRNRRQTIVIRLYSDITRHRSAILVDDSMNFISAVNSIKQPRTSLKQNLQSNSLLSSQLMHPNSAHIAAKYSKFIYENADYNFNSVGEFELTLTPATLLTQQAFPSASNEANHHSVILLPDLIELSDVKVDDIAFVYETFLRFPSVINLDNLRGSIATRKSNENFTLRATTIKDPIILVSTSSNYPIENSLRIVDWFAKQITSNVSVKYVLAADSFGRHPNCINILSLPSNKIYENVWSEEIVRQIIQELNLN